MIELTVNSVLPEFQTENMFPPSKTLFDVAQIFSNIAGNIFFIITIYIICIIFFGQE